MVELDFHIPNTQSKNGVSRTVAGPSWQPMNTGRMFVLDVRSMQRGTAKRGRGLQAVSV